MSEIHAISIPLFNTFETSFEKCLVVRQHHAAGEGIVCPPFYLPAPPTFECYTDDRCNEDHPIHGSPVIVPIYIYFERSTGRFPAKRAAVFPAKAAGLGYGARHRLDKGSVIHQWSETGIRSAVYFMIAKHAWPPPSTPGPRFTT